MPTKKKQIMPDTADNNKATQWSSEQQPGNPIPGLIKCIGNVRALMDENSNLKLQLQDYKELKKERDSLRDQLEDSRADRERLQSQLDSSLTEEENKKILPAKDGTKDLLDHFNQKDHCITELADQIARAIKTPAQTSILRNDSDHPVVVIAQKEEDASELDALPAAVEEEGEMDTDALVNALKDAPLGPTLTAAEEGGKMDIHAEMDAAGLDDEQQRLVSDKPSSGNNQTGSESMTARKEHVATAAPAPYSSVSSTAALPIGDGIATAQKLVANDGGNQPNATSEEDPSGNPGSETATKTHTETSVLPHDVVGSVASDKENDTATQVAPQKARMTLSARKKRWSLSPQRAKMTLSAKEKCAKQILGPCEPVEDRAGDQVAEHVANPKLRMMTDAEMEELRKMLG
ncbi:expressed unknown protein [Seminavis robusta]|uniref:Uncharacterized protein n=1 Tax=Seminavis robusta TaxID=568900 RepID=A0A9N8E3Z6_9STRA|nr:expressed unknown protein [Seminavis robusta]|eukprot:Sro528_g160780.1 n/a (405) ;mRNA; r:5165-6379